MCCVVLCCVVLRCVVLCCVAFAFASHLLFESQIVRCRDPDHNARKFACFAIGNSGFHNDVLYPYLKDSIPALIELLSDPEEKTRANASGALGNLLRNSGIALRGRDRRRDCRWAQPLRGSSPAVAGHAMRASQPHRRALCGLAATPGRCRKGQTAAALGDGPMEHIATPLASGHHIARRAQALRAVWGGIGSDMPVSFGPTPTLVSCWEMGLWCSSSAPGFASDIRSS